MSFNFFSNTKALGFILLIACGIMVLAGLRPKGFYRHNDVVRLPCNKGIQIGPQGIAFTQTPKPPGLENFLQKDFTIEIALQSSYEKQDRLAAVMSIWNERDSRLISICQWNSNLDIFSHNGYAIESVNHLSTHINIGKEYLLTIVSITGKGVNLFLNGELLAFSKKISLSADKAFLPSLVLGCFPSGTNPWSGKIRGLSLLQRQLSPDEVTKRYTHYVKAKTLETDSAAVALYCFNGKDIFSEKDITGKFGNLLLPVNFIIPKKQFLELPWAEFKFNRSFLRDLIMNLFGFIPFGFFLAAFLTSSSVMSRYRLVIYTLLSALCFSLSLEIAQGFIPTRASQSIDVILNVTGALLGVYMLINNPLPGWFNQSGS